ncbi:hypothetical protein EB796_018657 [Bugula neritina]|uniref:Uncharacterized protein n=1 Tax=Bugula neritina TaxID=10212 RepID=A0A7J7JBL4_BUGNE|nr:hypothetical protein EB796_018657 [Bugula neritina]
MWIGSLLLLCCLLEVITSSSVGFNEDSTQYNGKPTRTTAGSKAKHLCRFRWEWESMIYGDLCLPAKASLRSRKKSSSLLRHKHRHKSKDYNDAPSSRSSQYSSDLLSEDEKSVLGLLGPPQYQMDAPTYLYKTVSSCFLNVCLQGATGLPGAQGSMGKTGDPVSL